MPRISDLRPATQATLPIAPAPLPAPPKRARLAISDAQKQALRAYWPNTNPKPTQSVCAAWFQSQFNHKISRVSVSRIVSPYYKHLDIGPNTANMRSSSYFWPILEQKLAN